VIIKRIKPGRFTLVLRNLHISAIIVNSLAVLLALALVPLKTILGGANVLSVLAEVVIRSSNLPTPRWLTGYLTGIREVVADLGRR